MGVLQPPVVFSTCSNRPSGILNAENLFMMWARHVFSINYSKYSGQEILPCDGLEKRSGRFEWCGDLHNSKIDGVNLVQTNDKFR